MQTPYVADIKRNALDDGPGIRSTVFFKGCPLSCVWCHNPECIKAAPELLYRAEVCIDCGTCRTACERGAIGVCGAARLDRGRCALAGGCVDACPAGALESVGTRWSLEALTAQLLLDRSFYDRSGGGVTLSGGEATLYLEYCGALAERLEQQAVHVLLETCAHFDWDRFAASVLPHLDTIYVDLKLIDPQAHARYCGRSNAVILDNIDRLLSLDGPRPDVLVRLPLVPGITATDDNLSATAAWLRARGVARLALLRYNPLWTSKARGLGQAPRFDHPGWMPEDEVDRARAWFAGFEVLLG